MAAFMMYLILKICIFLISEQIKLTASNQMYRYTHDISQNGKNNVFENDRHFFKGKYSLVTFPYKNSVASNNLQSFDKQSSFKKRLMDAPYNKYIPGTRAFSFSLPTLGGVFNYNSTDHSDSDINPVIFVVYNSQSGFLQCLWNCTGSVEDLVKSSPVNTKYVFIPSGESAYEEAIWMRERTKTAVKKVYTSLDEASFTKKKEVLGFLDQLHFVSVSLSNLGNAIPEVLQQWMCLDHNCGFAQIVFHSKTISENLHHPLITVRLDARYDWLPSPESAIKEPKSAVYIQDSCSPSTLVKGKLAVVMSGNCSYFTSVKAMEQSGAVGVIVMSKNGPQDMNCGGVECSEMLSIPATSIPYYDILSKPQNLTAYFQTTPSDNFFMAIDHRGNLAEVGWFLYPTMHFLAWQAQWFNYRAELDKNLTKEAYMVNIFNKTVMHGSPGAQNTLSLPSKKDLALYSSIELDTSLSCPGNLDRDCPHWDHTVGLTVCCNKMCNLELGRWITSFRRRIGRWLTDVTHLLPLLDGSLCTFTMATAQWALPWLPSLNLRFSGKRKTGDLYPSDLLPLYNGNGFIFDKKYNSNFKPVMFTVPSGVVKVSVSAVITGHGSDENGCGEFCNTSHHFVINKQHQHSIYFNISGTPLGCADKVPLGVTPNEHGTWLYGRDGWCDGQDVKPWLFDITSDIDLKGNNTLSYHGYFNGTDPNPKRNPGVMIISSYIVMYKKL